MRNHIKHWQRIVTASQFPTTRLWITVFIVPQCWWSSRNRGTQSASGKFKTSCNVFFSEFISQMQCYEVVVSWRQLLAGW